MTPIIPRTPSWKIILLVLILSFLGGTLIWMDHKSEQFNHVEPTLANPTNRTIPQINELRLSDKWYHDIDIESDKDESRFHLVTNIILLNHGTDGWGTELLYDDRPPTAEELAARQKEVEMSLQTNLNHPLIAAVHVVYHDPAVPTWLQTLKLKNSNKLILYHAQRNPTAGFNLYYIQKYLMGRYVILVHMDCALGEGWEDIDLTKLKSLNMMYALTRHFPAGCPRPRAACNGDWTYHGSHDAFVFFMAKPLPTEVFKGLDIPPYSSGMENLVMYYFRKDGGFKTLNPCLRVKLIHNHCVPIRSDESKRIRYNTYGPNGKDAYEPFTDKLF